MHTEKGNESTIELLRFHGFCSHYMHPDWYELRIPDGDFLRFISGDEPRLMRMNKASVLEWRIALHCVPDYIVEAVIETAVEKLASEASK